MNQLNTYNTYVTVEQAFEYFQRTNEAKNLAKSTIDNYDMAFKKFRRIF